MGRRAERLSNQVRICGEGYEFIFPRDRWRLGAARRTFRASASPRTLRIFSPTRTYLCRRGGAARQGVRQLSERRRRASCVCRGPLWPSRRGGGAAATAGSGAGAAGPHGFSDWMRITRSAPSRVTTGIVMRPKQTTCASARGVRAQRRPQRAAEGEGQRWSVRQSEVHLRNAARRTPVMMAENHRAVSSRLRGLREPRVLSEGATNAP